MLYSPARKACFLIRDFFPTDSIDSYINTADLLAQARARSQTCDFNAFQGEIIKNLNSAKSLPGFKPNLVSDRAKSALAGTITIKEIMGDVELFSPNLDQFTKAMNDTYFENSGSGVYGPSQKLFFKRGGSLELLQLEVDDTTGKSEYKKIMGTWGVGQSAKDEYGRQIIRVWFKVKGDTKAYRLERSNNGYDNGWILKTKDLPNAPGIPRYYNGIVSECEA